jgi:alpha-ketoglutarate-dependent taurine dioxygenase
MENLAKLKIAGKRRTIRSSTEMVRIEPLVDLGRPPMIVQCVEPLELSTWAKENLLLIESLLQQAGAVLFRGFLPEGQSEMGKFNQAIHLELMNYMEGATPRRPLGNSVYTSTEFPPEQTIALHNENSYVISWPMKVNFCCVVAPQDRGETPIADVRKVLARIRPAIRQRFQQKGYMLVRNFSEHLGLPWTTSFNVSTRLEVEDYCRRAWIEPTWKDDHHLMTRQVRPATARHPRTHEEVWFNHIAFWHVSSLAQSVRQMLLNDYREEGLPFGTYFGDGSRIEDDLVAELRQAYEAETVRFPWQQGDLLLVDNMLVAHGRSPYSGARKIIVSMGEPYTRTDMTRNLGE